MQWRPGRPPAEGAGRPPLPALPLFPALPGYPEFDRELATLGFRHAADLLSPPERRPADCFRVLDGLWFPGPGRLWLRAGAAHCQAAYDSWRGCGAERLAARLAELAHADPVALDRLVLYQVCCRLRDAPTVDEAAAVALGVHPGEARELAASVAAHFPAAGPAREAAGELAGAWHARRLRHAAQLARQLPSGAPADPFLTVLRDELRAAAEAVEHHLDQAHRRIASGDHRAAATHALAAARLASDDPRPRPQLLRIAAQAADAGTDAAVAAAVEDGTVRLSWPAAAPGVRYQVLRFPDGQPERAVELGAGTDASARDAEPPVAIPLRYAVIPWRGERMAGIAKAAAAVVLLPEPERLTARAVPDGVRVEWQAHPASRLARAVRLGGADPAVACERESLTERPLPAGEHRYLVSLGYPGPNGEIRWSAGRRIVALAEEWPAPVRALTARRRPGEGHAELSWPRPERGVSRLVSWPGPPPPPGTDISATAKAAANGAGHPGVADRDGAALRVTVPMPPRSVTRLTAVSVLGERAVAGATVVLDSPGPAGDLRVRRLGARRAELRFRWPEPAVLAVLTWTAGVGDGARLERRLARSLHGTGRVEIPVSRGEHLVTLTPAARPDAALADCPTAQALLPALPLPLAVWETSRHAVRSAARRVAWAVRRALRRGRRATARG